MRSKIILFTAVCFAAAAAFAAYVDQGKKTAAMDTITASNNQAPQRGSSGIQFTKSGSGTGGNPTNHSGGGSGGGYGGGGYTGGGAGAGSGTGSGDGGTTTTKTPCPSTCPAGQTRTNWQYSEDGPCCSVPGAVKTPCDLTCPAGQTRTSTAYKEDGPCCAAAPNGKTPCTTMSCPWGKTGNAYNEDSGGCCVPCGWVQNTRINKTQYCSVNQGSCYIEGSVQYALSKRPACTTSNKGATWNVPGANPGLCIPKSSDSGGVICPGSVAGWEDPYVCKCN